MHKQYTFAISFFMLSLFPGSLLAAQSINSNMVEQVLHSPQAGRWQIIHIPMSWQKRYWSDASYQSAYIALRGPDANDLANYAPCQAPSRLFLGIEDQEDQRQEYLLTCLDTCSAKDNAKKVYRDLWARDTHLAGVTAQLLQSGEIEIIEHFLEILHHNDRKRASDVAQVEKNIFGQEKRLRSHKFSVTDFKNAIKSKSSSSCIGRSLNPSF